MADARRMGKMELFAHFADKFDMKRTQVRDLFDELNRLSEKELKRSGEFVLPGMCKLVVQKRKAREGRNPATGEPMLPSGTRASFHFRCVFVTSPVPVGSTAMPGPPRPLSA